MGGKGWQRQRQRWRRARENNGGEGGDERVHIPYHSERTCKDRFVVVLILQWSLYFSTDWYTVSLYRVY